jgi:integrase/recombinase XerD
MATLKLILDQRRKKNSCPLIFRINSGNSKREISTGIKLEPWQFDQETEQIIDNVALNLQVQAAKLDYLTKINLYLIENRGSCDLDELCRRLNKKQEKEVTIISFWQEQIEILNSVGRTGNAKAYKNALSTISQCINLKKPFAKLTYKDLEDLESRLYKRGMTTNGIAIYLRSFKAVYNKAINHDIVSFEHYPFRKFKIKRAATTPRVLTVDELRAYFNLNLDRSSTYYKSWQIGKLIFMMRGINLKDLLLSTDRNIKSGRLIYRRAKTKKLYSIPLLPCMKEVLNEFDSTDVSLLGAFREEKMRDKVEFVEVMSQKRKVINSHLKKIGRMIGSKEPITTYVFRYSFSNLAKQLGYSKDLISEALGHNYGNSTTSHYLEQFHQDELDDLTKAVIARVM